MTAPAADQDVRDRLCSDLDTTFFVEAGAGTGKTRELVARIVALVARGRVAMEGLVAITFTEAAAAELRDRVRQGLAAAAQDEVRWPEPEQRSRCARAAREVDLAAVSTIHAFAASLLRAYPLEAGLPPGFAVLDEVQQGQAFEERFREWLYDEVPLEDGSGRREAVARALSLGMTPDKLREVAQRLREHYELRARETRWPYDPPPDAVALAHIWGRTLVDLEPLTACAKNGEADRLVQEVLGVQFAAHRLLQAADEGEALAALQRFLLRPPKQKGNKKDWDGTILGVDDPVGFVKGTFKDAIAAITEGVAAHRTAALSDVLVHLAVFTRAHAEERRAQGTAGFHDLLVWARDLLRDHPEVRRAAAERYQRVCVDEFQDTDPLQAELVTFLVADPAYAEVRAWETLLDHLVPGKLFLVGDPKQSIYRFRGADIAIYEALYARTGPNTERAVLVQTRRAVEPIVRWVNAHFPTVMQHAPGVQARYEPLVARPPLEGVAIEDADCGLRTVGRGGDGLRAAERWQREADDVARVAHHIVDERWPVSVREGERWFERPARFGDVCVLLPTRTNLRRLERAFERYDVPYRVESGSLVLHTQEVRDLLSCLRAIDDPSDQVALVAALRSPAYACSDVDLLAWVEADGRLDYERPGTGCDGPVRDALASLAAFHARRMQRSAADTIEAFIRERGLAVQAFGQPRPREAWRRLRYVEAQARKLAASGQPTLRQLLDWLERLQASTYYDAESAAPEGDEDAVRVLTVHGAKGLEFPVAILTGLGSKGGGGSDRVQVTADHLARSVQVRVPSSGAVFQTRGYDRDGEAALEAAEQVRLLYVAATRAREHLVISLHHKSNENTAARRIAEVLAASEEPLHRALEVADREAPEPLEPEPEPAGQTPDEHADREREWVAERTRLLASLAAERVATPSGVNREANGSAESAREDLVRGAAEIEEVVRLPRVSRGGTDLGRAVHAVLQWLDLESLANLDALADWAAVEHGVRAAEVRRYARRAAESEPVRRAVASGRYWREAPVSAAVDGTLVEGAMDLLYEHPDGGLGIVDYKTDRVDPASVAERASHYRLQAGAYALVVERVTGRPVSSVEFVFAALEAGGPVSYTGEEVTRIVREAAAALEGRLAAARCAEGGVKADNPALSV